MLQFLSYSFPEAFCYISVEDPLNLQGIVLKVTGPKQA